MPMLISTNRFREQILRLRRIKYRNPTDMLSASNYFAVTHSELRVVLEHSFKDEYRKVADVLGKPLAYLPLLNV